MGLCFQTPQAYQMVIEQKLFKKHLAKVDTISALDRKEMGVRSLNQKSGSVVIRVVVPSAASLVSLDIRRAMPIFLLGKYAGYSMPVQSGNYKIIDVCGDSVSVEKCCGVIVGRPHLSPDACAGFRVQRQAAAARFDELEVKRAFQVKAAARG